MLAIEIQLFCCFQPVKQTHFGWLNHRVLVDVAPISFGLSISHLFLTASLLLIKSNFM